MLAIAQTIMLSEGWRRRLIAFAAGAAGALAMAPFDIFPALAIPMVCAVWLIDGSSQVGGGWSFAGIRAAAQSGWWLGFGYFVAGLWWLGAAFLVEADQFAWALPLGVVGLPAVLACFTAFGFAMSRAIWLPGAGRVLSLAAGLGLSEWLRGNVFTGFPWNNFGMSLGGNLYLAQIASVVGLYGLTSIAIAIFAAPATVVDGRGGLSRAFAIACIALAGLGFFGAWRLSGPLPASVPGVKLRLVQPNVVKDNKFRPENKDRLISDYLALSDTATSPKSTGVADATHLVWPESSFPFILSAEPQVLSRIGGILSQSTVLVTGAARLGEKAAGEKRAPVYNSMQVVVAGGVIQQSYDKVHLAPFGEYVPFAHLLETVGLRQFTLSSFTPGSRRKLLNVPGLPPVAPLICYEAIFSGEVTPEGSEGGGPRPGLLLNITDDSWFGRTPGPYQHLAQARLRSIEEGLPLVRDAGSGISAVIDPYGRIQNSLPLGVAGVLDSALPVALPPTPFAKFPMTGPVTIWLLILFSALMLRLRV